MREARWTLDTPWGRYSAALGTVGRSSVQAARDPASRRAFETWLMAARTPGRSQAQLLEAARWLAPPLALPSLASEGLLREAYARGRLHLERLPDRVPLAPDAPQESFAHDGADRRSTQDELTWIAIRLEYDGGSGQGVPYARYRAKLPDGTTHEGQLDRDGNARIDGLHPGMCEVIFPDFDARPGAPPPKIPKGKGHQARAVNPGKPPPPNVVGIGAGRVRCVASAIQLFDRVKKPLKRKASARKVLQVVAVPTRKRSLELKLSAGPSSIEFEGSHSDEKTDAATGAKHKRDIGIGSKGAKISEERTGAESKATKKSDHAVSAEQVADLLKRWRSASDFKTFMRSLRAEAAEPKAEDPSKHEPKVEVVGSGTLFTGGVFPLRATLTRSPECGSRHPLLVSGGIAATLDSIEDQALLTWSGGDERNERAKPTSYVTRGHGCEGEETVTIEVFPGEQVIHAGSMSLEVGGSGLISGVAGWLTKALGASVEVSWSAKGSIDVFSGWREEEDDWWASYSDEVALAGAWIPKAKVTVPLLPMVAKVVPASLLRYIANAELEIELTGGIKVSGTFTHRTAPAVPSRTGTEGEAAVEGSVDLGAVLKGSIGKDDVLGASLAGSFKADGSITGAGTYEGDALQFSLKASSKKGKVSFAVLTTALVWKAEWGWEYELWKDAKAGPWKTDPWPVHGTSGARHGS